MALSFTGLLYPAYEEKVYNLAQPFMLAEVAIMLWLAIMGAKEQRLAVLCTLFAEGAPRV